MRPAYDAPTLAICRKALDGVLVDARFLNCKSVSALQIAEHILSCASTGVRDFEQLQNAAFGLIRSKAA